MFHPEFSRMLVSDHVAVLRRDARRVRAHTPRRVVDTKDVELRLCRVGDDLELEQLAALSERPLPFGRLVVAAVAGRIVAAVPIGGGCALRDPFVRTEHLLPLLELRAAQLREPEPRRAWLPRYASLIRGSTQA
jgi:hypothetical protein